jgi:hypothetical protein
VKKPNQPIFRNAQNCGLPRAKPGQFRCAFIEHKKRCVNLGDYLLNNGLRLCRFHVGFVVQHCGAEIKQRPEEV